jgi:tRNA threonylcarbamoyladenosine biosynthesis protein TsaB
MLLAIDTSTRYAGVALGAEGRVVSVSSWFSSVNHTVELMPAISAILQSQGLSAADLSGIAVALGPGGFSALRVGVSVAKGLAMTAGKPLVGVGTLDLEAFPYLESGLPVCALLDAGRQEVAVAHFGPDGRRDRDDVVGTPQALFEAVGVPTIFCGEGVQTRIQMIKDRLGALAVIVKAAPGARLWPLLEMGGEKLAAGEADDIAALQPSYLRMPSIGGPKRRDWAPQGSPRVIG